MSESEAVHQLIGLVIGILFGAFTTYFVMKRFLK